MSTADADRVARVERLRADVADAADTTQTMLKAIATIDLLSAALARQTDGRERALAMGEQLVAALDRERADGDAARAEVTRLRAEIDVERARVNRLHADLDRSHATVVAARANAAADLKHAHIDVEAALDAGRRARADLERLLDELDDCGDAKTTDGALLVAELRARWIGDVQR